MRSIIEEIATAEAQAEEIRANAAQASRERMQNAEAEATQSMEQLEAEARAAYQAALYQAAQDGDALAKRLAEESAAQADAMCAGAEARIADAVAYLLNKAQEIA